MKRSPPMAAAMLAAVVAATSCSTREDSASPVDAGHFGEGAGPDSGRAASSSCSEAIIQVGTRCHDTVSTATATTYAFALGARTYARARVVSNVGAVTLAGTYDKETLRAEERGLRPSLAFYNDADAPLRVSLEIAPQNASGTSELSIEAAPFEPSIACTGDCSALLQLPAPRMTGPYRLVSPPRYQFGRRELVQMVAFATAEVRTVYPAAPPLGVADYSQEDGSVPGADVGEPRHPAPSHTHGFSIDIAYFRTNGDALGTNSACPSPSDRQFCSGAHDLDLPPTVATMIALAKSGRLAQIIVDPVMETDVRNETLRQRAAGADTAAADKVSALLVSGIPFHADHFHVSVSRACFDGKDNDGDGRIDLDDPGCADAVDDSE